MCAIAQHGNLILDRRTPAQGKVVEALVIQGQAFLEINMAQSDGSDCGMVFEGASKVQLIGQPDVHYAQDIWIGSAFPYGMK